MTEPDWKEYYFTFGSGHAHPKGYYTILAETRLEARIKMTSLFGPFWSFDYKTKEAAGVDEFNLIEVGRAKVYPHEIKDLEYRVKACINNTFIQS